MPQGNDFSYVDPTETVTLTWDFGPMVSAGVTISTPATDCSVLAGTDAGAAGRLIGSPVVQTSPITGIGAQAVLQQVQDMLPSVLYKLTCTVHTSDQQVLTIYAHQLCQEPR